MHGHVLRNAHAALDWLGQPCRENCTCSALGRAINATSAMGAFTASLLIALGVKR